MVDVEDDGEGAGPEARARDRVRFSVRCTGSIGILLEFGPGSDVRMMARFRFSLQ